MAIIPILNEKELLTKVAGGDERAFKLIYEAYYDRIYSFAFHLLQSPELAQEVLQETMLKVWQLGDRLTEIRRLEGYLKTISRHRAIDLLRRKELESQTEHNLNAAHKDAHNDTEESILLNETRRILEEGIRLLPRQQRRVFRLCHQQGLKYEQAAKQLGVSHRTVQTHMKLALKFLRIHIQKHSEIAALVIILKLF